MCPLSKVAEYLFSRNRFCSAFELCLMSDVYFLRGQCQSQGVGFFRQARAMFKKSFYLLAQMPK